jgi:glycolate oxidase FAD binding subunit
VRFEGFGPGVAQQRERFIALAEERRLAAEVLEDGAARTFWSRHEGLRTEGDLRTKIAAPPAALAEVVHGALCPLAGIDSSAAVLYPTLGVAFTSGTARGNPAPAITAIGAAREALARLGGTLVVTAAPTPVRVSLDVWGPPPASLAIMRRVKDELDPDHRLAPGRFVGGL